MRPGGLHRGAPDRPARPSWSAATPSSPSNSRTPTACSRPSCARSAACCWPCADEARVPGGCRAGGRPGGLLPGGARAGDRPSQHHGRARRGRRSCPSPGVVATGPLTSDALGRAPSSAGSGPVGARLLRRHRADRLPTTRSITTRLYALSRYGKGEGDDYLNAPMTRRSTRPSSTRWSRRTSSPATSSTRCRTSRGACRSRRWRGAAGRRCASAR